MNVEKTISDVASPWVVNVFFFTTLGVGLGAVPAGLVAALFTGVFPRLWIFALMRRGNVAHRHVTARQERTPVFIGIVACLLALIVVLQLVETPHVMWVCVWAALGFIVLFAAVTVLVKFKISIHVGLWLTVFGCLGIVLSPWWFIGLMGLPVIAWSRVALGQHSRKEVAGGAIAGLAVLGVAALAL